jgi:streptomycin 6-kinase
VHAARTFADTTALLLERCRPGTALADVVPEPEQDVIIAGLLRRLWHEPVAGHPFRSLQVMCDQWAAEFAGKLAACPDAVDGGLAAAGMALFRTLPATAGRRVVLCTDMHGENVLAAQRQPWLVIDPKPYVGDPTYDVVQHMVTCEQRLAADPRGFAQRMADLLGLDTQRLTWWLFARCVLESIDQPGLRAVAARLAP